MPLIKIDGIQLGYDEAGSGPPVVLVHGYPFNRSLWNDQGTALRDDHRVITIDLRGFGESDASEGSATMDRMAQDIAALLDALKVSTTTIGGLSMGGYVVLSFYKQFRSRVKALLLADTRAQADTEEAKQVRIEQRDQILSEGMGGIADAMLPKLLTPETVSKRTDIVKRVRDMMISIKPAGAAAALLGMAEREDQTELLSQVSVPTLIVVGREDPITPVQDSEIMHSKIVGSKLVILEKAAHVSNLEQVDLFNQELRAFLSETGN